MSDSLATAAAAPIDGYPIYTHRALAQFQSEMPNLTNLERATSHMFEVIDFTKSPQGMLCYEKWAKKELPENPYDRAALMKAIEVRFLGQGQRKSQTQPLVPENAPVGSTGDAAQPS